MSEDLHTLSGAFALDALNESEAEQFRNHLLGCTGCALEVSELREAAALMGSIESRPVPESLKARVLAVADRTPQLPPRVTSLDSVRRRSWLTAAAGIVAAAVVVAGVGVGISRLGDDEVPLAGGVSQVFDASDAHTAQVSTDRGSVSVAVSSSTGRVALDVRDLEPLDDEHVYQVWALDENGGTPTSMAVLSGGPGASMPLPESGTRLALTVEPAPHSKVPTTTPFIEVDPSTV